MKWSARVIFLTVVDLTVADLIEAEDEAADVIETMLRRFALEDGKASRMHRQQRNMQKYMQRGHRVTSWHLRHLVDLGAGTSLDFEQPICNAIFGVGGNKGRKGEKVGQECTGVLVSLVSKK